MIHLVISASTKACILLAGFGTQALPVGGWSGKWLQPEECIKHMHKGQSFDYFEAEEGYANRFVVKELPDTRDLSNEEYISSEEITVLGEEEGPYVAVATNCPSRIRKATEIPVDNPTYKNITREFLKSKGYGSDAPMFITQILKTDLENDGTDEVFITVQSSEDYEVVWDSGNATGPFYCYTFMRKVGKDGKVRTTVLMKDEPDEKGVEAGTALTYSTYIMGFADLNGDGISEIVIKHEYYEGWEIGIGVLKNGEMEIISGAGMGA